MKNKNFLKLIVICILVAVTSSLAVGVGFFTWAKRNPQTFTQLIDPKIVAEQASATKTVGTPEEVIVNTVKKADPAVVVIAISKELPTYERYFEQVPNPYLGDEYTLSVPRYRQNGVKQVEVGGGSGFLVSSDGYIVTNRHVVGDENAKYSVRTNDGKEYPAKIVAVDSTHDLAVIKINGTGFDYLPFGNSDELELGQSVIAIGNALAEFSNTVSVGIISGLSRSIVTRDDKGRSESLHQLIQTDAAINKGNSGGPLLNLKGEVIGVSVAVAEGAENIGFAISANTVKEVVASVKKNTILVRN